LSIEQANICSSEQDHRQKFDILNWPWKNKKRAKETTKGSVKHLKTNCYWRQTAPEVMMSSEAEVH